MFNRQYMDPYIIAEIGMNHEGSMVRAKAMIESVARAGGHAAKFQTYKAETLASVKNSPAYWDVTKEPTQSQFELFQRFDSFEREQYEELAEFCAGVGVDFLSTPFDLDSVEWLAPLMPAIKIASADLTNVPLLRKVAATRKPVILSVGASTHDEIQNSLVTLTDAGAIEIALLHCVLRYPTPHEDANLLGIRELQESFGSRATIGYSDHVAPAPSGDAPALEMAVTLGARIIEKHFTDDRSGLGNDHYHALDEEGIRQFVERISTFRELAGTGIPDIEVQNAAVVNARRRIIVRRNLSAGKTLNEGDLIPLRSDVGIEVSHWDSVIGAQLAVDKADGDPLVEADLK